ncbi:hypothetical protein PDE_00294 [Penicillium oxalicum 114-2]|uniref:UBX domain-containing protein n=1 Tax=Penicillium oxalicum (strain 114-2 / CGMCC 5302) TaxID=933388 RepID=S7Z9N1_PENO1|nr:hypothetical protein PDE_00294 [Penicillium oxalicum 114-2]
MSAAEVDLDQLSDSERLALDQYSGVTGQDPAEAIPLLRRSQWNVQIAISKFFDGEGPDPLEEARAALSEPAQPFQPRPGVNLMHEDILQQVRPSRHSSEPAPRIDTQPENQPAHRPPLILAIIFTPFNLIYRLLLSSFRLFGTLFPFLPRLLHATASPALQGTRQNTTGRRPLAPKDTAARFIREFEEEYGANPLPFLENGYNMALERAHRELKFLLVVLLSPEHDDTHTWVRETLLSPEVVEVINPSGSDGEVVVWGGNVRDSEAYQVANSLRVTKFPFAAVICHTPNVSSTAMSVVARIGGPLSASEFKQRLTTALDSNRAPLSQIRQERSQQQASRNLREEQDSAYERSLAIDRERARLRREAEAAQQREEQAAAEREAAEQKHQRDLAQWKLWRVQQLGAEPEADEKDTVRVSVRLPSGDRIMRRFAPDADIEELYAVVECYETLQDESRPTDVEKPDGYEHQYGFRLVSPMPRAVHALEGGGTLREKIGRGGNLLVEPIEEDEEENDDDEGMAENNST